MPKIRSISEIDHIYFLAINSNSADNE